MLKQKSHMPQNVAQVIVHAEVFGKYWKMGRRSGRGKRSRLIKL
jgi:hypothetical protein